MERSERKTRGKRPLYPGVKEAEAERTRSSAASRAYDMEEHDLTRMTYDDIPHMTYDEYQRWLVLMNID